MSNECTPWIRQNKQWMYTLDLVKWAVNIHPGSGGMSRKCTPWIKLIEWWMYTLDQADWAMNVHPGSGGMSRALCTPWIRQNKQWIYTLDQVEWAGNVHPGSGGKSRDCTSWIRLNEQWMYTLDQVEWVLSEHPGPECMEPTEMWHPSVYMETGYRHQYTAAVVMQTPTGAQKHWYMSEFNTIHRWMYSHTHKVNESQSLHTSGWTQNTHTHTHTHTSAPTTHMAHVWGGGGVGMNGQRG